MKLKNAPQYLKTGLESIFWSPHTRLFIKGDNANWSLYWDAVELTAICRKLGIHVIDAKYRRLIKGQCFFNMSRYEFLENWQKPDCRIAFPYYHGNPAWDDKSRGMLKTIRQHHEDISRIQVSCRFMEETVLDTGIAHEKVFRIPIGINLDHFSPAGPGQKKQRRAALGIPENAVVIGSFQKDGNGWSEGLEPKMEKGPDIFLKAMEILKDEVQGLFVLLTGPARGYVKNGLDRLGIPFAHHFLNDYLDIGKYYHALDAYVISSRDEGGPKAVLESMASGVPLISTGVGQATDLIEHGNNGFLADIEDAEALAHWTLAVMQDKAQQATVVQNGILTAKANAYTNQLSAWKSFMKGYVD